MEIERGLYENKRLKIRDNPGFLTTINVDSFTNNILIEMSSIDNIHYLPSISKQLYSLILLTQNTYNKDYKRLVDSLCKRKVKEVTQIADIVAPAEQELSKHARAQITDLQELTFGESDDEMDDGDDDYLNQLIGDEEDEDEDEVKSEDEVNTEDEGADVNNSQMDSNTSIGGGPTPELPSLEESPSVEGNILTNNPNMNIGSDDKEESSIITNLVQSVL